jgi:hypothetical protein
MLSHMQSSKSRTITHSTLVMEEEVPWEALMAAMRRIQTQNPSKTPKEVLETLATRGDTAELAAMKKLCSRVTSSLTKQRKSADDRKGKVESTDAAALMNKMLCDPHTLANMSLLLTGRDLSAVLENIDDYDIEMNCFTCNAAVSDHHSRCSQCKAVLYCSTACQTADWKDGSANGRKSHRHWCPQLQKHMARLPETQSLAKFFPWLRLTASGIFPRDQVLAALGLLGEDKGYWSRPSSRAAHAAQHSQPKTYGVMLYRASFPDDDEAWRLPPSAYPRLRSLSTDCCPSPLRGRQLFTWQDYYQWRGLPASSVAALMMEFPLTLYFTICQLPRLMEMANITVHLLGCEKELEFLPLFGELSLLLPHTSIRLVLFGMELAQCYLRAPAGSLARTSPLFEYTAPPIFDNTAVHRMTITWEHSHATWQDAIHSGAVLRPDLVWAPNAGVATYPQWQDAIHMCAFLRVPLATSEYCEYSVEMEVDIYDRVLQQAEKEGCVGVASARPRRFLNPFRNPGQRPFPMSLAPNLSNGFCTILDLDSAAETDNRAPAATPPGAHATGGVHVKERPYDVPGLSIVSHHMECVQCHRVVWRGVCLRCVVHSKRHSKRNVRTPDFIRNAVEWRPETSL